MSQHTKKIHDVYDCTLKFRLFKSQYDFLVSYVQSLDPSLSVSGYFRKHIDFLMSRGNNNEHIKTDSVYIL